MGQEKDKPMPITADEVDAELYRLGTLKIRLDQQMAELNAELDRVKKSHLNPIEKLQAAIREREETLEARCEAARPDLLPRNAKTLKLLFGQIAWKRRPPKIEFQPGVSSDTAAERLCDAGRPALTRMKLEVDKPAVMAAVDAGKVSASWLSNVGLRVAPGFDQFSYGLDHKRIEEESARRQAG